MFFQKKSKAYPLSLKRIKETLITPKKLSSMILSQKTLRELSPCFKPKENIQRSLTITTLLKSSTSKEEK